jgi:glucose/arabinose dehydrogenase
MLLTLRRGLCFAVILLGFALSFSSAQTAAALAPSPATTSPNLYVAGLNTVISVTESGEVSKLPTIIPQAPTGDFTGQSLLIDSKGTLFAWFAFPKSDVDGFIAKFLPNGTWSSFTQGLGSDMAINAKGDVFVSGTGTIYKTDSRGTSGVFTTGLSSGSGGMAFDANGDLFVANYRDGLISKIIISKTTGLPGPAVIFARLNPPRSSFLDKLPSWLSFLPGMAQYGPISLTFGPDGNLYVATEVSGASKTLADSRAIIFKLTPTGQVSTFADGFKGLSQLAF